MTGVYDPPRLSSLLGTALVSQEAFDSAFPRAKDRLRLAGPRAASEAGAAALESSLAAFPDADVKTVASFTEDYAADLSTILNLLYVLLALSVVVSLFGMVNTMVLAVHERTREIGMLRAVGMTRRQARRMVRGESVITALIGAALGLPLGRRPGRGGHRVAVGLRRRAGAAGRGLVVFALVAVAVGVLAAIAPARRASRLDVLVALQYE